LFSVSFFWIPVRRSQRYQIGYTPIGLQAVALHEIS